MDRYDGDSPADGAAVASSRRRVLARIGVGAAAVWVVPSVITLDRAGAAEGSAPPDSTTTTATTAPSGPVLDFSQTDNRGTQQLINQAGPNEVWQPFVAGRSGALVELTVLAGIEDAGPGPIDVAVHEADPVTGLPVGPAIGSGQLAEAPPAPPAPMTIVLSTPVPVTTGSTYVLVFTKPTPSGYWWLGTGPEKGFPYYNKYFFMDDPLVTPIRATLWLQTWVL